MLAMLHHILSCDDLIIAQTFLVLPCCTNRLAIMLTHSYIHTLIHHAEVWLCVWMYECLSHLALSQMQVHICLCNQYRSALSGSAPLRQRETERGRERQSCSLPVSLVCDREQLSSWVHLVWVWEIPLLSPTPNHLSFSHYPTLSHYNSPPLYSVSG